GAFLSPLRVAAVLIVAVSMVSGIGLTFGTRQVPGGDQHASDNGQAKADRSKPAADAFGDPLPPGALARMGTIRLRQPFPRMVFSPDGKSLTSVGADHMVHTWDVATGKHLRSKVLEGTFDLDASAISLAPDGKTLLVWKPSRKSAAVYDVATGKELGSVAV